MRESELVRFFLEERRDPARRPALLLALLLHLVLLTVTLPSMVRHIPEPATIVCGLEAAPWRPPPPRLDLAVPAAEQHALAARKVPVPDPEPDAPEPVSEPRRLAPPQPPAPSVPVEVMGAVPPPSARGLPFRPGMDGVSFPVLLEQTRVLPKYPAAARQARVYGTVILQAIVLADGTVGDVKVLRVPGPGMGFEEAAVRAVRQWRYRPGMQNGRPVAVQFTVVMDFILE